MGGVDIADQHRAAYKTQRKAMRNWLPHWYWMIDHTTINAFKMAVYSPAKTWTQREHRGFRVRLYQELFAFKEAAEEKKQLHKLGIERLDPHVQHVWIQTVRKACT